MGYRLLSSLRRSAVLPIQKFRRISVPVSGGGKAIKGSRYAVPEMKAP